MHTSSFANMQLQKLTGEEVSSKYPNYSLLPVCKAVILLFDRFDDLPHLNSRSEDYVKKWSLEQTILVIRTGDESHLSAPISFESIREHSSPIGREGTHNGEHVLRIPISIAVRFIAELQKREEKAFPERINRAVDPSLCPDIDEYGDDALQADTWVKRKIQEADEKGIDNVETTWDAVRRVRGVELGERVDRLHFSPARLGPNWIWS